MSRSATDTALKAMVRKAKRRDRRAISQLMSVAENDPVARIKVLSMLYWLRGRAYIIGVTGTPGCGKSTLIAQLAKKYREGTGDVGIVAIDPSSHVSGGALLGDRIRMNELASDPHVFIRSMATRGHSGGIAGATKDVVRILDATGTDYVIVETAGAGQSDVDVKALVHTTVVVTAPGLGDEIQALKAGIMEIGDIFVVNKADRENADRTMRDLHSIVMMSEQTAEWRPRVLKTVATFGEGINALTQAIEQHSEFLKSSGRSLNEEPKRLRCEVLEAAKKYFDDIALEEIATGDEFAKLMAQVEAHKTDPYTAARTVVRQILHNPRVRHGSKRPRRRVV